MTHIVASALKHYDLPDLVKAIATRPVSCVQEPEIDPVHVEYVPDDDRMIMHRYTKNKFEHFVFQYFINTCPMYLIHPWYSPPEEEMKKQYLPESEISLFEIMQVIAPLALANGNLS